MSTETKRFAATKENLTLMVDFLKQGCQQKGVDKKFLRKIQLVADEVFINIINYAYPDKAGDIEISYTFQDNELTIQVTDWGTPFDPTAKADPNIHLPLEERPIGGLGVFIVRKIMDEVNYKRKNNRNILTMIKRWH